MEESQQQEADRRFAEALEEAGARDPRDYYRDRLRDLKQVDPGAYQQAVSHYEDILIPSIARGEAEPLAAWRAYGLEIAKLTAPGRTVAIDATGKAEAYEHPGPPGSMILHLPEKRGTRPLLVGLPPAPSPAQMAAYDWLVGGRKKLRDQ